MLLTSKVKWTVDMDGTWICFQVGKKEALAECERFEPDIVHEVTVKNHKEKRSIEANAYCWVLCGKIAEKLKITKEEVYKEAIKHIGDNFSIVCIQNKAVDDFVNGWSKNGIGWICEKLDSKIDGCTNVLCYYGSSTYTTEQMSALIDSVVEEAKTLGIDTATPDEIAKMKALWGERNG